MARGAEYAAVVTEALAAEMIPTIIAPELTASASRQEVFRPRCKQYNMTGEGGALDVVCAPSLAFAVQSSEGAANDDLGFNTTKRTLNPALHVADVAVSLQTSMNSSINVTDQIVKEGAVALAADRDARGCALYTEAPASAPDHEIGTDGTKLSMTSLKDGMALLYAQNAPRRFAWLVNGGQWIELLDDATFANASFKGSPVMTKGLGENGYGTSFLDVDIYVTSEIIASSGTAYWSMMFSDQEAFGYGYKLLNSPLSPSMQEVLVDVAYNSGDRAYEVNMSYFADIEGVKGTTTANNWSVAIVS